MANIDTIRILVIDDQNLIRRTIQMYLERESDLEIVGYAASGAEALTKLANLNPDVAIVDLEMPDLEMPDLDGLALIKIIRDRFSNVKILVFSSHDEQENINRAIEAGAKGYLIKGTPARELANAVRSVNQGYFQLGPGLMEKLVISMSNSAEVTSRSIERKLINTLKKYRRITQKQLYKIAQTEGTKLEQNLDRKAGMYLHTFNRRYSELYSQVNRVQFQLYLLGSIQIIILIAIVYWIVAS